MFIPNHQFVFLELLKVSQIGEYYMTIQGNSRKGRAASSASRYASQENNLIGNLKVIKRSGS